MSFGKRLGWLALVLVALIAAFVAQIVGGLVGMFAYIMPRMSELYMENPNPSQEAIDAIIMQVETDGMGLVLICAHVAMLICFAIWYYYGCGRPNLKKAAAHGAFSGKTLGVMVLIALGMCFFTNFALPVVSLIIPEGIMNDYIELMEQAGFGVDTMAIIASVLLAPFGEEFICRGVMYHYAKKTVSDLENRRLAFWVANSIQAIMFGVLHGNIVQGSYAFVVGLALGYLRERFNSLVPCILAHMVINAVSSFVWEPVASMLPESYIVYTIGAVIFLAIAFVGLRIGGPVGKTEAVEIAELV